MKAQLVKKEAEVQRERKEQVVSVDQGDHQVRQDLQA